MGAACGDEPRGHPCPVAAATSPGAAPHGPPPHEAAASVDAVALAAALRQLPLRHRQAVVLHYLVGMSVEETGLTLGATGGTVKGWLARARRALASQLDEGEVRVRHG